MKFVRAFLLLATGCASTDAAVRFEVAPTVESRPAAMVSPPAAPAPPSAERLWGQPIALADIEQLPEQVSYREVTRRFGAGEPGEVGLIGYRIQGGEGEVWFLFLPRNMATKERFSDENLYCALVAVTGAPTAPASIVWPPRLKGQTIDAAIQDLLH